MSFDFKNVPTILYVHGNHIQSIFCQVLCMYMNTALSIVFSSTVLLFTSLVFVKIFFSSRGESKGNFLSFFYVA